MNNRGYAFAKAVVATPASRQRFFRSHTRRRRRNYLIVPLLGVLVLVGVAHAQESINLRRTVTVDVVARTKNAVVYISTTKLVAQRMSPFPQDMFLRDLDLGFGRIVKVPQNALGSGFVVHPSGYVVTNNHVIERRAADQSRAGGWAQAGCGVDQL
jgi:S1-C subfamily serine protease